MRLELLSCPNLCSYRDRKLKPFFNFIGRRHCPNFPHKGLFLKVNMIKSFSKYGYLSFFISDQNTSIYELKISRWVNSLIYQVKGEDGNTYSRTCNDVEGFADRIDWSRERTVSSKSQKQPLWTIFKILQNRRETSNFALGQKYNVEQFQYLKGGVNQNYRE